MTAPRILIVLGHPRGDSLCAALAEAYCHGAAAAGADVRMIAAGELDFLPDVITPSPRQQPLEPDLEQAKEAIAWAEHLVFVYPSWWGTMPAVLKGFLDRVLLPGFAFEDDPVENRYEPLLTGRTGQILTTMDTPPWVYRWIYGRPGHNAMRRATLGFCGIRPVRVTAFGPVKGAAAERRQGWLDWARREGARFGRDGKAAAETWASRLGAWVQAARLQFYPMTWIAYSAGALAAAAASGRLDPGAYWLGYLVLFLLELAAVLINEVYDRPSDVLNHNFGPFSGGSRVLVTGRLSLAEMRGGIGVALLATFAAAAVLMAQATVPAGGVGPVLAGLAVLALGYTAPPLKFCHRGLGELVVGLTHSAGVVVAGWTIQGGSWTAPLPWLLSLPLFLAILPAIILSGLPDHPADRAAGKRSLAVVLGPRGAAALALVLTVAAAVAAVLCSAFGIASPAFAGIGWFVVPHAVLLGGMIGRRLRDGRLSGRLDGLMAAALSFILWFGAVPAVNLM